VPHKQESALIVLHRVANAPIFGYSEGQVGNGIVGGRLVALTQQGREGAQAAMRLLDEERGSVVKAAPVLRTHPWRGAQ